MKKINVLMIGSDLSVKGGMTTVVENFLSNNFEDRINISYIPTHIEKNNLIKQIYFLKSLIKIYYYLLFKNIDLVHVHMSERGSFHRKYLVFKLSKLLNKKVIVHMHGAEFKEFFEESSDNLKKKIIYFLREANLVLVLGDSWNDYVLSLDKDIKIKILRNSIQIRTEVVKRNKNNINVLFLAVLIERKGIIDLIEAVNLLEKEKRMENYNIKYIVAGSGQEEKRCKELVLKYKLEKYFDFKGWVSGEEKQCLLKQSQIFVLPSYNEGLPMAILEAMSYGIPVISTNVGSIEDAVKDNVNGFIVNPGDIKKLASSIEECVKNEILWNEFSKKNKDDIENKYSNKIYFDNIEKIYCNLIR